MASPVLKRFLSNLLQEQYDKRSRDDRVSPEEPLPSSTARPTSISKANREKNDVAKSLSKTSGRLPTDVIEDNAKSHPTNRDMRVMKLMMARQSMDKGLLLLPTCTSLTKMCLCGHISSSSNTQSSRDLPSVRPHDLKQFLTSALEATNATLPFHEDDERTTTTNGLAPTTNPEDRWASSCTQRRSGARRISMKRGSTPTYRDSPIKGPRRTVSYPGRRSHQRQQEENCRRLMVDGSSRSSLPTNDRWAPCCTSSSLLRPHQSVQTTWTTDSNASTASSRRSSFGDSPMREPRRKPFSIHTSTTSASNLVALGEMIDKALDAVEFTSLSDSVRSAYF